MVVFIWCLNLRVALIMDADYSTAAAVNSARTVTVATSRGYIYDRNYVPLVNRVKQHQAAVLPCAQALEALGGNFDDTQVDILQDGKPYVVSTFYRRPDTDTVKYFDTAIRYGTSAAHIVGYTNAEGSGVCGIEQSFDALLSDTSGTVEVSYTADAWGNALPTGSLTLREKNYDSKGGVRLTLDSYIQEVCEAAAEQFRLTAGAIVVLKADTAEILASVSVPTFDPANPAASLQDETSPFLNRALTPYATGSIFKVVTAAAALEQGIDPNFSYTCTGSIDVGGTIFHCHKHDGHGTLDMTGALANSCNTYFIALAQEIGGKPILELSKQLGLGSSNALAASITDATGTLPDEKSLSNSGEIANFAFGQGTLSTTPLQMAAVYAAIANGGIYIRPYLLMEQLNNHGDAVAEYIPDAGVRVMQTTTAETIGGMLQVTVTDGSGRNAQPSTTTAAGKTATAQSGIFSDGEEILRTWFCGYFPADNPEYVISVMKENGSSPTTDCAPIFKFIADSLYPSVS